MEPRTRRNTLVTAGLAIAALYLIPYGRIALLPAIYLNTHLHELAHAFAALITGGTPVRILVESSGAGQCLTRGGIPLVISSAGYVGASLLGVAMILVGRSEAGARVVLGGAAGLLTAGMILYVRGDLIGIVSGIFWIVLLGIAANGLRRDLLPVAAQFLGLVQGLQSLASLGDLLRISATAQVNSDAQNMAALTGIPALVWAILWAGFSIGATGWALWRASRSGPTSPPRVAP